MYVLVSYPYSRTDESVSCNLLQGNVANCHWEIVPVWHRYICSATVIGLVDD